MFAYEQCLLCLGHHPDVWYEAATYLSTTSKRMQEKGVISSNTLIVPVVKINVMFSFLTRDVYNESLVSGVFLDMRIATCIRGPDFLCQYFQRNKRSSHFDRYKYIFVCMQMVFVMTKRIFGSLTSLWCLADLWRVARDAFWNENKVLSISAFLVTESFWARACISVCCAEVCKGNFSSACRLQPNCTLHILVSMTFTQHFSDALVERNVSLRIGKGLYYDCHSSCCEKCILQ